MARLSPKDMTIAITVYDRREYINQAIGSALAQHCVERPQVIVVEDCGPDTRLRESLLAEFGNQIIYYRNQRRRGLFDNWNACIDACCTSWLCILHDDDFLEPTFVESMIELSEAAPDRALYYGVCDVVDGAGQYLSKKPRSIRFMWHELNLEDWVRYDPVCFPSKLFNAAAARALGGFRSASRYCADWEMWFKLTLAHGSAATNRVVATYREHHSIGRGTTEVDISGRKFACGNMQRKRHIAWLSKLRPNLRFDRKALLKQAPMSTRYILEHGYKFSPRMLRYNAGLLYLSSAPHLGYRVLQMLSKLLTWRSLRELSFLFRLLKHLHPTFSRTDSVHQPLHD